MLAFPYEDDWQNRLAVWVEPHGAHWHLLWVPKEMWTDWMWNIAHAMSSLMLRLHELRLTNLCRPRSTRFTFQCMVEGFCFVSKMAKTLVDDIHTRDSKEWGFALTCGLISWVNCLKQQAAVFVFLEHTILLVLTHWILTLSLHFNSIEVLIIFPTAVKVSRQQNNIA